ncbi:MAG: class I SAM-dependent methyltransferase [Candidatus Diapherotrites archaeon]|uniref:Class I SAM-dependent methyltransferase n=1 Tax=Candidatus Iainarchaeum sp. TaxID=3101447 RepID=A0A8T4C602_9ARCH|nr:class I SAM-dependent methyltransferase [Candidatus Diapherotrites archaeon]
MTGSVHDYVEKYSLGVILRDNTLSEYNTFLKNLGEHTSLEKIAAEYVKRKGSCRILDIGCGNGQALHELKQHVSTLVHAIGIDLLPLHDARVLDEFIQGNVHDVPLPSECDIIVSFRALHEIGSLEQLLPRVTNALGKGGRAYLWIRFRKIVEGKIVFEGEMNEHEEKYLQTMASQRELGNCRVLVESVPLPIPGQAHHKPAYAAGYIIVMLRQ